MGDPVASELHRARERLLDLTLRNRLLNFRPTRRTTIRIVDELPAEVWRLLVEEDRKLAFLARSEHELFAPGPGRSAPTDDPETPAAEGDAAEELFALPDVRTALDGDDQELPSRYTDLFLQSPLDGEDLQTNLLQIERQARSLVEERGVNLLFLALGFLHFRPDEAEDRVAAAPLILLPVALERTSARHRFKVKALGEEPVVNPCLRQKLREFRIDLPEAPDDWDGFDVEAFLEATRRAVAGQRDWHVEDEIFLGFFTFVKYLMYVDLDPSRWPVDEPLTDHRLVRVVCGDDAAAGEKAEVPEAIDLDEALSPEDVFEVLNADSSQQEAILAVREGASLVIEGPPGTGKSQTIANLIAQCLADGRSVLFVSEKLAALEVVKRRLDQVALGDFCLELHSTKATRRAVAGELGRILEKGRYRAAAEPTGAQKLSRLRRRLNAYVRAVHEPYGPRQITPYDAMGRIALLADVPLVPCAIPGHEAWGREQLDAAAETLRRLGRQMRSVAPASEHPWRGSRLTTLTAPTQREIAGRCEALAALLDDVFESASRVAGLLGASAPSTLRVAQATLATARLVLDSPEPADRLLTESVWDDPDAELRTVVTKVHRLVAAQQWMAGRYVPDALDAGDWLAVSRRCREYWHSLGRWFRPGYWSDRGLLKRCRESAHRPGGAELAGDLRRLAEAQALRDDLAGLDALGTAAFDDAWRGVSSDWARLAAVADWLARFRSCVSAGRIADAGVALASRGADRAALHDAAGELSAQWGDWHGAWEELQTAAELEDPGLFDVELARVPSDDLGRRLHRMAEESDLLFGWARYQESLQDAQAGPLAEFLSAALVENVQPEVLPLAMEKQSLCLLMERVLAEREPLRQFDAAEHEADVLAFARLDREWIAQTALRLHGRLASHRPQGRQRPAGSSQLGILQGEVRRKRGGRSIRRLLADAPDAIRRLKPCFMMSPLSVAQFLAPEGMRFDVVIFDEASQVEPADALGAIARGRQLVLVGDPKQLPPTPFFAAAGGVSAPAGEGDGAPGLVDMESILDRGATVLETRRLRWHYRSRHESLIAFSNRRFYGGDLVTFPSCHTDTSALGLSMVYEPADAYDRGRSQTNRAQARRIAAHVIEHARSRPGESLGVGAFSQRQQQAILDEVEKLRRLDETCEGFFDRDRAEPFFVKNLETIQGDERDVILLSVGYGKSEPSERLSMNFGPLNQAGGWRRLNVLITRARRRCVVFTSIVADDFDLAATQAPGVHALKAYLDFARSGSLPRVEGGEGRSDSALAKAVFNALTERGVMLERRVGSAGWAIDLAVVDEHRPGRYVLGIECDGASYRAGGTARDRDRIRRLVLESLGWRIHRVWSPEYFRSPRRQIEKVLEVIGKARAGRLAPQLLVADVPARPAPAAGEDVPDGLAPLDGGPAVPAYEVYAPRTARSPEDFYAAGGDELAKLVAAIADVEGPIHRGEVVRRVCAAFGLSRAGRRIEEKIARAVGIAETRELLSLREEFVWPLGMSEPPVRRRDELDEDVRNVEWICREEIARAARLVLEAQFSMTQEDLVAQVARLLGFQHTGTRIRDRVEEVIAGEIGAGRIAREAGGLVGFAET